MPEQKNNRQDRHLLNLVIIVFTLVVLSIAWLKFLQPRVLPVKHVRIEGEFVHLLPEKLRQMSTRLVRGGFFNVNVSVVREKLLAEPWVNSVTVRRVWPDTLVLYIQEQVPVARWNKTQLVNSDGDLFKPDSDSIPTSLPHFTGPYGTHRDLLEVHSYLQNKLQPMSLEVENLAMDARRSLFFTLKDGPGVMLGKNNFSERIDRFARYAAIQVKTVLNDAEIIDMRYTNGFAVRNAPTAELSTRTE